MINLILMSSNLGHFKKTEFLKFEDAISFVRSNNLKNIRLKQNTKGRVIEWDNL